MKKLLVYDMPTRLFHWLFAGLFLTTFAIAKTIDDDSPIFSYHMLMGLTLTFLVILRIVWGFLGTKHARFSDFILNPTEVFAYIKGILSGDKKKWAGHNPATSWAAIMMMGLTLGLGITGYLMSTGQKKAFEDVHELFANCFIVVVILHVAGIILHTIRHREMIGLNMINGTKDDVAVDQVIPSSKSGVAVLLMGLIVAFGLTLYKNYDSQSRVLQFFGSTLQLGENENEESGGNESHEKGGSEEDVDTDE